LNISAIHSQLRQGVIKSNLNSATYSLFYISKVILKADNTIYRYASQNCKYYL